MSRLVFADAAFGYGLFFGKDLKWEYRLWEDSLRSLWFW